MVYHLGGGTLQSDNPRKTYLNFRNNLMMLYKNLSGRSLFPVIFVRLLLDGVAASGWLVSGKTEMFKAVWSAHRDFFRKRRELKTSRHAVQNARRANPRFIYKGSIVFRYILGKKYFGNIL